MAQSYKNIRIFGGGGSINSSCPAWQRLYSLNYILKILLIQMTSGLSESFLHVKGGFKVFIDIKCSQSMKIVLEIPPPSKNFWLRI